MSEIDLDADSDPGHDIFVSQPIPKCSEHTLFVFIQSSDTKVQQDFLPRIEAWGPELRTSLWDHQISISEKQYPASPQAT